jgi:hypothetical protein
MPLHQYRTVVDILQILFLFHFLTMALLPAPNPRTKINNADPESRHCSRDSLADGVTLRVEFSYVFFAQRKVYQVRYAVNLFYFLSMALLQAPNPRTKINNADPE